MNLHYILNPRKRSRPALDIGPCAVKRRSRLIHFGSGRDTFNRDTAGIRGVARTMKTDGTRRATSASTAVADSTTPPCEIMRQATRNVPATNWFAQAIDQVHRAAAANLSFLNQLIRSLGPSD